MTVSLIVDNTTNWTGITDVAHGKAIVARPILTADFPRPQFARPHYVVSSPIGWSLLPVTVVENDEFFTDDKGCCLDFYSNVPSFQDLFYKFRGQFKFFAVE